jgi:hypothetical protein
MITYWAIASVSFALGFVVAGLFHSRPRSLADDAKEHP